MVHPVEPVAVVGMACRFPQADGVDAYWRLLRDGRDAITEATEQRWPSAALSEFRRAGFLDSVDTFDAELFGIDPAEANAMDPQHRLVLELTWHALEDARLTTERMRGEAVGVFAAAINQDYALLAGEAAGSGTDRHTYAGTQRSMMANRLSYLLSFRGPSLTVDTGQSSSLVAVHMACDNLRAGDCDVAIAGSANLNLRAETTAAIGEFGALSPDGSCRVFDRRANGYVRGEGGAVVVLKKLTDAVAAGDPIRGVILGSAVNNDGGGETLTAPTVRAQRDAIALAHDRAGVRSDDVGYVELHGTATRVGDPVEAAALGETLGQGRVDNPLRVGSVKTNIGHLEGTAGLAGLIKTVLSVENAQLVPTLNYDEPNPEIDLDALGLDVVTDPAPWSQEQRLVAGVSSFGMGGTNCHVVVGSAPETTPGPGGEREPSSGLPWVVSAAGLAALRETARAVADLATEVDDDEIAVALARTRSTLAYRAVCLGGSRSESARIVADGQLAPDAVVGRARNERCAFVFPGQGSQWRAMARDLINESPGFADALARCADELAPFVDYSIHDVLWERPGSASFDRVDVVQPALWAMMVALAEQWMDAGVRPDVVIGHSQGEIAAATVAGALSLSDGARIVALRSRALADIAGTGGMLSVQASVDVVERYIAEHAPDATVAAVNSRDAVVLSGTNEDLGELQGQLTMSGFHARLVPVDYASHSAAVERLRTEVVSSLSAVRPRSTSTTVLSTVTGEAIETETMDAEYWYEGLRRRVQFGPVVEAALGMGIGVFVESSPHPVLSSAIEETIEGSGADAVAVPTLRRDDGGLAQLRRSIALGHVSGLTVDWGGGDGATAGLVRLPHYPLQAKRYWIGDEGSQSGPETEPTREPLTRAASLDLVRDVMTSVLGDEQPACVSENESFRDIGVDSARALEIRSRLRQLTGQPLPVGVLFERPTPRLLADLLSRQSDDRPRAAASVSSASPEPDDAADDSGSIAIVGMACRLPGGVSTPNELWDLVREGRDAIGDFPTDRGWDIDRLVGADTEGSAASATSSGGFLDDMAGFDAAFFGISPREAVAIDPQQRLLLTTAWEALERSGMDPASLQGSDTGVFVGGMPTDYGPPLHDPSPEVEGHLLTGTALSVLSGRLAYTLGLNGPALTVDTACSSSLVATHLAIKALRAGDCSLAMAGGVTLMSTPGMFVEFSRQGGLSRDGRCKAFSAAADGTGWAEGAGIVVLERLSDAERQGRTILGVLRGSAVNQDGHSNGLTAPNGRAQEQVIESALADAGLDPSDVDAVEAHGTGTSLGDPIEAQALANTYGAAHDGNRPLWLGSIKSNLGHTQAAAGVASLIKTVQALRHDLLPKTLHVDDPTPHIDWSGSGISLLAEDVALDDAGSSQKPVRVGVSGFGISGTNAHVIVERAKTPTPVFDPDEGAFPMAWAFSARSETALATFADELRDHTTQATDLAATGRALAARGRFDHRAVVVASDRDELLAGLDAVAHGTPHPAAVTGVAQRAADCVFVFPGQGTQWVGMARDLLAESDLFWEAMCECDGAFAPHVDWSVLDVVRCETDAPALEGTEVIQPVLFSVMVSLARTWRSYGVDPAMVLGHSQGEIAAACVAGAVSLDDAARLVVHRSRALTRLGDIGGMVAVSASAERAEELIEPWADRLSVAIHSSPDATVVGGDRDALAEFQDTHDGSVQMRRVAIGYAAHTSQIERIEPELRAASDGMETGPCDVQICSSLVGDLVDSADLGPDFWYRGLREPVLFAQATEQAATTLEHPLFIEVSPHPALVGHVDDTVHRAGLDASTGSTLRRDHGGLGQLMRSLGTAFVAGAPVDWSAVAGSGSTDIDVPTYPFEHRRFWVPDSRTRLPHGFEPSGHPLIDAVLPTHDGGFVVAASVSRQQTSWLADHVVAGRTLLPGTALLEMATAAAEVAGCQEVDDLTIIAPLPIPRTGTVSLQIAVGPPDDDGRRSLAVHGRGTDEQRAWVRHADGVCRVGDDGRSDPTPLASPDGAEELSSAEMYVGLNDLGYTYGPAFRALRRAWRVSDGWLAELALPDGVDVGDHLLHPALLDASMHAAVRELGQEGLLLPYEWRGVRVRRSGARAVRAQVTLAGPDRLSMVVFDEADVAVAVVDELVLRRVSHDELPQDAEAPGALDEQGPGHIGKSDATGLSEIVWEALAAPPTDVAGSSWALIGDDVAAGASMRASGIKVRQLFDLPSLADLVVDDPPAVIVVPLRSEPVEDIGDDTRGAVLDALATVQTFISDERLAESRLLLLTDDTVPSAAIWGLIRAAQAEHPDRIAVAALEPMAVDWPAIAGAIAAGESQLRMVEGHLSVPRLAAVESDDSAEPRLDPDKTVLVTGGTGGLGALVASHLVEVHGARHLLLLSRSGRDADGVDSVVEQLEHGGARVTVAAADVSIRRSLRRALDEVDPSHPIGAVVHLAGATDDAPVAQLSAAQFDDVLAAKVDGAVNLYDLTRDLPVSSFVMFSSTAGVVGALGQANYAAANAAVDELANNWSTDDQSVVSISWGLWGHETAMTAGLSDADRARIARRGVGELTTDTGLALLDAAMTCGHPHVVASAWAAGGRGPSPSPLLRSVFVENEVPAKPHATGTSTRASGPDALGPSGDAGPAPESWTTMPPASARKALQDLVRTEVATVLGYAGAHEVTIDHEFADLGLDSLTVVELRNRLGGRTGLRLPATLAFDHPTVGALVEHLTAELIGEPENPQERLREVLDETREFVATDSAGREQLVGLLRNALRGLEHGERPNQVADDMTTASDRELFEFLDKS